MSYHYGDATVAPTILDRYSGSYGRPSGSGRPPLIYIYSYGIEVIGDPHRTHPRAVSIDCTTIPPPPKEMCDTLTGLDAELREYVFADPVFRYKYNGALGSIVRRAQIWDTMNEGPRMLVKVYCRGGVHRSVSMVIALVDALRGHYGLQCHTKHYTLQRAVEKRMERRARERYGHPF